MNDFVVAIVTAKDEEEAASIAKALVTERLAACANIIKGVRSIYSWKGDLCDDSECIMVIKTRAGLFDALAARVKELHSYYVPEVIAVPVTAGFKPYLDWVLENTRIA